MSIPLPEYRRIEIAEIKAPAGYILVINGAAKRIPPKCGNCGEDIRFIQPLADHVQCPKCGRQTPCQTIPTTANEIETR